MRAECIEETATDYRIGWMNITLNGPNITTILRLICLKFNDQQMKKIDGSQQHSSIRKQQHRAARL